MLKRYILINYASGSFQRDSCCEQTLFEVDGLRTLDKIGERRDGAHHGLLAGDSTAEGELGEVNIELDLGEQLSLRRTGRFR